MKMARYIALGDSYTICEGAAWEESWPVIMTRHLNESGAPTQLIANPSRTGWTTRDLIINELPVFNASDPDFATLLIGVNDWVQQVTPGIYRQHLHYILNAIQKKIEKKIVLISIPDFSVTPDGPKYSQGRDISRGLLEFNAIMEKEASDRGLEWVDIYPVSLEMKGRPDLVSSDNLHPSGKEYALWEKLILPAAIRAMKNG